MAIERHAIPRIALRAYKQERMRHAAALDAMGDETIDAMEVEGDGWIVDFEAGEIRRDVPTVPTEAPPTDG